MIINFIQFPHVYTDTGERILIADCVQQPRVGDRLELDEDMKIYKVYKSSDEACVSDICDIPKIG